MIGRPWLGIVAIPLVSITSSHAQPTPIAVTEAGTSIDPQAGRTLTSQPVVQKGIAR